MDNTHNKTKASDLASDLAGFLSDGLAGVSDGSGGVVRRWSSMDVSATSGTDSVTCLRSGCAPMGAPYLLDAFVVLDVDGTAVGSAYGRAAALRVADALSVRSRRLHTVVRSAAEAGPMSSGFLPLAPTRPDPLNPINPTGDHNMSNHSIPSHPCYCTEDVSAWGEDIISTDMVKVTVFVCDKCEGETHRDVEHWADRKPSPWGRGGTVPFVDGQHSPNDHLAHL